MSKASIKIGLAISGDAESGYTGSYTLDKKDKGKGSKDPSVSSGGDVTVYTDTDIKFAIKTSGFTFPTGGDAVIKIDGTNVSPGDTFGNFSIGSGQPKESATELKLEDDDADGTSAGTSHRFALYVVTGGTTYQLDPRFWNRN